ncbi:MAG: hypothetical protein V4521_02140 [Pseudomonadota bacterium]
MAEDEDGPIYFGSCPEHGGYRWQVEERGPRCEECGNDGTDGALYLTIDAQWDSERKGWEMRERDDEGGRSFDCLNCDHRTEAEGAESFFPYGALLRPPGGMRQMAAREGHKGDSLVLTIADGLDASTDGRGWDGTHQAAADLANSAPALRAALASLRHAATAFVEHGKQRHLDGLEAALAEAGAMLEPGN